MDVFYNNVAQNILKVGVNSFTPTKYRIEYRKNKALMDLVKVVNIVESKCEDVDDQITLLAINLKNIFKKMRRRKFTIVYTDKDSNVYKYIETEEPIDLLRKKYGDSAIVFSGHCKLEKG